MLKPLNNRVVVEPIGQEETASGFILTETKEKPVKGKVLVGNDIVRKDQKILFSKFGYDEADIDGKTYYVVSSANILAIFDK